MINFTLADILEITIKDIDCNLRSHCFKNADCFKNMFLYLIRFKRFVFICFLNGFIKSDIYNLYHRKVINRLKRLEVLHNV